MNVNMRNIEKTIAVILAGGEGKRLYPLTSGRAKPAVPFGGIYRIIDFTLSNCLHSGLRKILVLTQYKSHSLHKHLRDGWSIFNPEIGEFITSVPAQMQMGEAWYVGTADAIQQNRHLLERSRAEYALILSGDHIYRMDYGRLLAEHARKKADVTIACLPVPLTEARSFGVVETDHDHRAIGFIEKAQNPPPMPSRPDHALASMGIYVFHLGVLLDILAKDHRNETSEHDFGKNILPHIIKEYDVRIYESGKDSGRISHDHYWRDVGTLDAFYQANMDLLDPVPPIDLYQRDWAVRTYHGQYPCARMVRSSTGEAGSVTNAVLSGGDVIIGARITHSILSPNVWAESGAFVEDSILFSGVHVGEGARLFRCIVDKEVYIPKGEEIGYDLEKDRLRFTLSDNGVVVIPKGYRFPASLP